MVCRDCTAKKKMPTAGKDTGIDICTYIYTQETPLHLAAAAGHMECVYTLLVIYKRHGLPVDAVDCSGWTPLHKAIFYNSTSGIVFVCVCVCVYEFMCVCVWRMFVCVC
jgi:hypothetical protein